MKLENSKNAIMYIIDNLQTRGYKTRVIKYLNKGRHCHAEARIDEKKKQIYILFKRENLHSFPLLFAGNREAEGKGHGESINKEYLQYAITNECTLMYVKENGSIYVAFPKQIKNYCEKHNFIRTQNKEKIEAVGGYSKSKQIFKEVTYCFPINILERW